MKVLVSKLEANPFRKISKYPYDKDKLKALETSIKETTFWDNILARPNGSGGYQIAYGHHRLKVLKRASVGIKTVDIPVRKLDDATMIRIMANENMEDWGMSPVIINETVLAAKEYLDGEIAKYESLDKCPGNFTRALFAGKKGDFKHCKENGVGRNIILKFLGGNWQDWMVRDALATLSLDKKPYKRRDDVKVPIDRKAVEVMPTMRQAQKFKSAVADYELPKKQQKRVAEKIKREGSVKDSDIRDTIRRAAKHKPKKDPLVVQLERDFMSIEAQANSLNHKIRKFNLEMKRLKVTQIESVRAFSTIITFSDLLPAIKDLLGYLGYALKPGLLIKGKKK